MDRCLQSDVIRVLHSEVKKRGLTQGALADELELQPSQLSHFFNHKMSDPKAINRIIDKLIAYFHLEKKATYAKAMHIELHGLESAEHCMYLGDNLSLWYSRIGDGITPIAEKNIDLIFAPDEKVVWPDRMDRIVASVRQDHSGGRLKFTNNPLLTIMSGETSAWKGVGEDFYVKLVFAQTDYAALVALRGTEDGRKLLREYIEGWSPDILFESATGQGVGINVVVVSSDQQLIFGRRSAAVGIRKNQLDVSSVEGLSVEHDIKSQAAGSRHRFDLTPVGFRAIREELGVTENKVGAFSILNFGFDLQYAQWNFIALAQVKLTAREIRNRHRSVASQGVEYRELEWIGCDSSRRVFEFISGKKEPFWSCGLVSVYYSLIHMHGIDAVEDALNGIKFHPPERFIWE